MTKIKLAKKEEIPPMTTKEKLFYTLFGVLQIYFIINTITVAANWGVMALNYALGMFGVMLLLTVGIMIGRKRE